MAALLAGSCALAQQPSRQLRGTWTGTLGQSRVFRGTWTAETSTRSPNAAHGTWTILAGDGELLAEGTWSARKSAAGWQGTWTARSGNRPPLRGNWRAGVSNPSVKTFAGLLESTAKKYVAGVWQSGHLGGNWWLQGAPPRNRKP